MTEDDLVEKRKQRDVQLASNPHYLKGTYPNTTASTIASNQIQTETSNFINLDKPIDLSVPIILPGMEKQLEKKKPKKS